jgi:hypothetical protein
MNRCDTAGLAAQDGDMPISVGSHIAQNALVFQMESCLATDGDFVAFFLSKDWPLITPGTPGTTLQAGIRGGGALGPGRARARGRPRIQAMAHACGAPGAAASRLLRPVSRPAVAGSLIPAAWDAP